MAVHILLASIAAEAGLIQYESVLTISSMQFYSNSGEQRFIYDGGIGEFYVGDRFYLDYEINFSTLAASNSYFSGGLENFEILKDDENTGTWDSSSLSLEKFSPVTIEDGVNDFDRWRANIFGSSPYAIEKYIFTDMFMEYSDNGSGNALDTSGEINNLSDVFTIGYFDPTEFDSNVFHMFFHDLSSTDNESLVITGHLTNTQLAHLVPEPPTALLTSFLLATFFLRNRMNIKKSHRSCGANSG